LRHAKWLVISAGAVLVAVYLIQFGNGDKDKKEQVPPSGIKVEKPVVDLGKIRQGTTNSVSFRLKNHERSAVRLELVWSSCDCLKVELPKSPLAPDDEITIPMTWRIGGHRGLCGSRLILSARAENGSAEQIVLRVQGDVVADIGLSPKELTFTRGQPATGQIAVGPLLDNEEVVSVRSPSAFIQASFDPLRQVIQVSYNAAADPRDSDWVTLDIRTTSKNEPAILYTVWLVDRDSN